MSDTDSEVILNFRDEGDRNPLNNEQQDDGLGPDQEEDPNDNAQGDHMRIQGSNRNHRRVHENFMYMPDNIQLLPRQARSISIKPETFNGDDWDQYISHFENCAE